jgi:non-ribosomal peptide synthase protein (TIGR01720 family)
VLRYLTNHNQRLQLLARPEVSFNYQGQFDHNPSESSTTAVADPTTSNLSLLGQRRYLLEIDSGVYEGRLQVDWSYSECLHRRATIERLVEYFAAALRSLITHCSSNETGGYTPSDFSAARVSQDDLEKLLALIGANQPEVDQIDEV